jgi:autotransporter-associated beta strand protein
MKKIMLALLVSTAILMSAIPCSAQAPKLRIMPLGDSITYGSNNDGIGGGYRYPLYVALTNAGFNVDYIGTQTSLPHVGLGVEINHEGHSGWKISDPTSGLYENILGWFTTVGDPDVILLHIGTNDSGTLSTFTNAVDRLDALITRMAVAKPNARIIVTSLLKRSAPNYTNITNLFNPYVPGKVAAQAALGRRVTFLDMHAKLELSDMYDNLHPNNVGYGKMAAAWFPAITNIVTPYGDFVPPAVASVRASAVNTLTVTFSKPINLAASPAVTNPASWAISPAGTVTAVSTLSADLLSVTLGVSGLDSYAVSTLAFTGTITDLVPVDYGGPFSTSLSGTVGAFSVSGARAWTGFGADALWSTVANWTGYTAPSTSDTVLFTGAGNGKTAVTLGSAATAAGLTFAADAAAYTVGLPSETLSLPAARITLDTGSVNDQTVASTLLVGGNLDIYNNEPSKRLNLNYTNNASRNIYVYGTGPVTFDTLRRPAGTESNDTNYIQLQLRSPAPVTCTGPITIGQLWKDNTSLPSALILAPHTTNILCRNDWEFALSGATISGGEGTVLRLLHAQANTPAAIAIQTANPVTISCRLECPTGLATLNKGGGGWTRGTLVLSYPDNLIDGAVTIDRGNCFQVPFLAPNNTPNPLGACTNVNFVNPLDTGIYARLRVTGAAASSTDKAFTIDKDSAAIENAGSGLLTLSGTVSGNGTIIFDGTGPITFSGIRSGIGGLNKSGAGTLTLAAANSYSGVTVINNGTLVLAVGGTLGTNALTLASGGALSLNPSAAAGFSLTLPATTVSNFGRLIVAAPVSGTSTVTIPILALTSSNTTLSVTAPDVGASNRILVDNLVAGPVPWITLNGGPASYSATLGLIPFALTSTNHIATLGTVIPDAPSGAAIIDSEGTGGPNTLASVLTSLALLSQEYPADAIVDFGGGLLAANMIRQTSGAGGLTLQNGTLTANGANTNAALSGIGTITLVTLTTDEATGISPSKTYTHLLDFGTSTSNSTINGVSITKVSTASGTVGSYGWSGFPAGGTYSNWNDWTNNIPSSTGVGLRAMLYDMVYNAGNYTVKLTGLTLGAAYEFRLFLRSWDGRANTTDRTARFDFLTDAAGGPVASVTFDMNHSDPTAMVFRYVAATSELTLKTYYTVGTHPGFYGITNEKLADAPASLDTGRSVLAFATDGTAPIAVSAAVTDNGRTTALLKDGNGTLTLSGSVSHTGSTGLNGGLLDLAPTSGVTQTFAATISGPGAVMKRDAGTTLFLGPNNYGGLTVISNGILSVADSSSLGLTTAGTVVTPGGALALGAATYNSLVISELITLSGAGPDGLGALRLDVPNAQFNAFNNLALSGPTTVGGTAAISAFPYSSAPTATGRFDIRGGTFDFGGYPLTKAGPGAFFVTSSYITGITTNTSIDITGGVFGLEVSSNLQGSETNTLTVRSGAAFDFYNITLPILWTLLAENGAHLSARSGSSTQNNWAGPVALQSGTVTLNGTAARTFSGPISGMGGLVQGQGSTYLRNPANSFTGPTTITNGTLYASYDGTIPNPAGFTLSGGTFYAYLGDGAAPSTGWTSGGLNALVTQGAITAGDGLSFSLEATAYAAAIDAALPSCRIRKYGTNILTRSVGTPSPGMLHIHNGTLELTSGLWDAAANNKAFYVGAENNSGSLGVARLSGNAAFRHRDTGYKSSGSYTVVGDGATSRGILSIGGNASYAGRLYAGNNATAAGAVYQSGGTVLDFGGYNSDSRFGYSGFGYLDISGGSFTTKGYTQFGHQSNSYGTLHMTGGTFTFNSGAVPADGVVGDYYGGNLAVRGGNGHLFLEGGSLTTGSTYIQLPENQTQDAPLSAILTVGGTAEVSTAWLLTGNYEKNVPTSIVNLNGGRFSTGYIQKGSGTGVSANNANANTYINFNGGELALTAAGAVVRKSGTAPNPVLTVHEGGAVIDANTYNLSLDYPLAAASGMGVAAISVSSQGTGYIAPPFVLLSGGGGTGAVAVAELDTVPGKVTGFRILCPGSGYTSAPTVTLGGGGFITAASGATAVIGPVATTGGLSLKGPGTLTLTAANTYRGPTVVTNATLALSSAGSIMDSSALILDNATFSAPGRDLTNALLRVSGNATLSAGSLTAAALDKTGPGTLTLNARLALTTNAPAPVATDFTPVPGLAEGFVVGTGADSASANPRFAITSTWRGLNGYVGENLYINGAQWPNNTTYIYSGYLWNRQSSNLTWTFACNMDDHIQLKIDDAVVVERGSFIAGSDTTLKTITLAPGPHKFELRAGQGAGSVGGYWTRSDGSRIAIGVDKLNRGLAWSASAYFADTLEQLEDPGDGSLFTVNSPYEETLGLVPATGTNAVPADILAKVGAVADGFSVTYGTGVFPSNSADIYNCNPALWQTDNSADADPFDRVAYFVEMEHPTYGHRWVWAAFDAHTGNRRALAFPGKLAGERFQHQRKVSNLTVRSNVGDITDVTDSDTGNIEVFCANYTSTTMPSLGLNGRSDIYDFDDTASGSVAPNQTGYGCFQVHNWGAGQTLFAVDNFGGANNTLCMGIGNRPGAIQLPGSPQLDYTFDQNATGYTVRRFYILTRDLVPPAAPAPIATVTEGTLRVADAAVPADIRAKVGSVASEYEVVYASAVPTTSATIVNGTAYSIDNSNDTTSFDRVAYYLELVHPTYGSQWIWVSFDSHTTDRKKLGYPSQTGNLFTWQQKVANMNVVCSGVQGVTNYEASATGSLEIWPSNYTSTSVPSLGLGGNGGTYDFDDLINVATNSAGHGCFQIHNWGDKTTLMSITRLGSGSNPLGIGIGNNPAWSNNDPDYTFTYNAAQYTVRNFYVCVRPAVRSTGVNLAEVDLTIAAGAVLDLNASSQTVRSITGTGTISNGVLAAGTVISPAGDGMVGTLSLANVQIASGVQYRADLGDLLDVTGSLDTTGMVLHLINPEALVRSQTYTLIQTTGGLTGALPTVDAPLPVGWKVVRRGNALQLIADGGTLILFK